MIANDEREGQLKFKECQEKAHLLISNCVVDNPHASNQQLFAMANMEKYSIGLILRNRIEILFSSVKIAKVKYGGGYYERSISIRLVGVCMCMTFLESKLARYYKRLKLIQTL